MGSRGIKGAREVWTWLNVLISTGLFGRCCHLRATDGNQCKRRVPETSLIFCATGQEYMQLSDVLRVKTKPRTLYIKVFDPLLKKTFLRIMHLAEEPLDERYLRLLNPGYGNAIKEQGRKSTLPGLLTAGLLRQHLGLAGGDPQ